MKTMNLQKLIEENFSHKEQVDDGLEEDSFVKRTVNDILDDRIEEFPCSDLRDFPILQRKSFPADEILPSATYGGSRISRTSLEEEESETESEQSENVDDTDNNSENTKIVKRIIFREPLSNDETEKSEKSDENEGEIRNIKDSDSMESESDDDTNRESDIEDDLSNQSDNSDAPFMYSNAMMNESNNIEKGKAIRKQLNLCEVLLEARITLQKVLFASNQLPKPVNYNILWTELSVDEKNMIIDCREVVWDLFEKLLHIQCKFRSRCSEFMSMLDEATRQEYQEYSEIDGLKVKRRKLSEYPCVLRKMHEDFKLFRNDVIQKWNDRTKATSGKLAKNDFSAFDLPLVKQIEHIMADKERVIQRTYIKRSDYKIISDEKSSEHQNSKSDFDAEIFDDDDFYHKLLRDYIERKTADVSDPTQLGKKWIKLQSLRSKIKRKIDTRKTKGRKISSDIHPKLVNFMAPVRVDSWTDAAINDLFNSVFGKIAMNS